jgi:uncharacterized membrane protein YidH (DUF202 family)
MTPRAGDPGMATERTVLAWSRSAISLAAAGALLVRLAVDTPVPAVGLVVGGVDILVAAWLWMRADPVRRSRARLLKLVTAATVATAVTAVVLAFLD